MTIIDVHAHIVAVVAAYRRLRAHAEFFGGSLGKEPDRATGRVAAEQCSLRPT